MLAIKKAIKYFLIYCGLDLAYTVVSTGIMIIVLRSCPGIMEKISALGKWLLT